LVVLPEERLRWHYGQSLPPIEAAPEPDPCKAGGIGGASWLSLAFLREGELLTEKEILRSKHRTGVQSQAEVTCAVEQEHLQRSSELPDVAEHVRK
jgi:hypothetical protein